MDRAERITLLHDLLTRHRFGMRTTALLEACGCGRSTLYTDFAYMRDKLLAPVVNEGDPDAVWRYERAGYQLPGTWLSANELLTMLYAEQLLRHVAQDRTSSGLISQTLAPVQPRIHKFFGDRMHRLGRLRIRGVQIRTTNDEAFRLVTDGVLEACRMQFHYKARSSGRERTHKVSPQRLMHYRGNWYLDAFLHGAKKLLRYSVDSMRQPLLLRDQPSIDVPDAELDALNAGYGIFSGPVQGIAVIRFSEFAARWIRDEIWHPDQVPLNLDDGGLQLSLPYGNPQELLMDVQRYGEDAQILAPSSLRALMKERHLKAAASYAD